MTTRKDLILQAALTVFSRGGPHALTHRTVDTEAALPQGSTSNLYRTRAALLTATAEEVARRRLAQGDGPHDRALSIAWLETLLAAQRDEAVAQAIRPVRDEMLALLDSARSDDLPLSTAEVAALAVGLEYAEVVTGVSSAAVLRLLDRAAG